MTALSAGVAGSNFRLPMMGCQPGFEGSFRDTVGCDAVRPKFHRMATQIGTVIVIRDPMNLLGGYSLKTDKDHQESKVCVNLRQKPRLSE